MSLEPSSIKVAQLLFSGLGGHASVAFSLIDGDQNHEWRHTLGFHGTVPLAPTNIKDCIDRRVPYRYLPARPGKPWRGWPRIFFWLWAERPDAIVLHSTKALLPVWLYAKLRKAPFLAVDHTSHALKTFGEWVMTSAAMLLATRVILISPSSSAELSRVLGPLYRSARVAIIPNGIDTNVFAPITTPFPQQLIRRIGMAARFSPTKRQDLLVMMMTHLSQISPGIEWQLTLAGDGTEVDRVRALAAGSRAVIFEGVLSGPQLVKWFQSLTVYIHASDGETLSTSILQAMACGIAIVASEVPGIIGQLGGTPPAGILVHEATPEAFADAVAYIVAAPEVMKTVASTARTRVANDFTHSGMFRAYSEVLRVTSSRANLDSR